MQMVLELLTAALFLLALALALGRLSGRLPAAPAPLQPPDRRAERAVFLAALVLGGGMAAAVVLRAVLLFPGAGAFETYFEGGLLDARHYRDLARWGYGRGEDFFEQQLMIVFFPLFPWLMRAVCAVGLPFYPAAMAVNLFLFAAGAALTFRITARRWGARCGLFAAAFAGLMPGSFFFVLPLTEALFFFLSAAFFDAVERRRWTLAALAGIALGLTRLPGVTLAALPAAVFLGGLCRRQWRWGSLAAAAGPAVGVAGYLVLNAAVTGDPLAFLEIQRTHWHNRPGSFWRTAGAMWRQFCSWWESERALAVFVGLWSALALIGVLALLAAAARRLPAGWTAAALACFAAVSASSWTPSAGRYLLCLPALGPALALAATGWRRRLLLALTALAGMVYFAAFLTGAPGF